MDYEKKYKEALKRAEKALEVLGTDKCEGARQIFSLFPELKESEDERIRKGLVKAVSGTFEGTKLFDTDVTREEALAWLEKQEGCEYIKKDWLEHIKQSWYKEGFIDGKYTPKEWTINDAKDGDVLCTYECDEPKIVFILKGTPKKHYALSYHCYYNIMYPHFAPDSEKGCLAPNDEDVKPATKEQRDILFAKMKEAGYEWDAEKKGLKKISQRMVSAEAKEALYDKPINQ